MERTQADQAAACGLQPDTIAGDHFRQIDLFQDPIDILLFYHNLNEIGLEYTSFHVLESVKFILVLLDVGSDYGRPEATDGDVWLCIVTYLFQLLHDRGSNP